MTPQGDCQRGVRQHLHKMAEAQREVSAHGQQLCREILRNKLSSILNCIKKISFRIQLELTTYVNTKHCLL
jgi:hypothetical protein